jgi:glycine/D-amino acid oxidase-like deaminating enzyme
MRSAARSQRSTADVVAAARPISFWLDDPAAPEPAPSLSGAVRADLVVVGAGFTGLWTAFLAKQADPGLDVVVLESERVGWAATGRNGGFCAASLTHGEENGRHKFPDTFERLQKLGMENLDAIEQFVSDHHVDCGWERTGELSVATQPWQLAALRGGGDLPPGFLDRDALREELASPTYLGGVWDRDGCAVVNPARLAWAIRQAALEAGVRIFERTPVRALRRSGPRRRASGAFGRGGVEVLTPAGRVRTGRAVLATNAFPSLLPGVRSRIVPVYDYVLVTEPLSTEDLASVGWRHRQGVGDSGNRFHYYRLTADNRILWGGFDAIYHYGRRVTPVFDQRASTFHVLAEHFYETFPQLSHVGFTHRWGGAIDTCARFCAFYGTALGGRLAYAAGYTGLGVGASRFGARVMLDLLSGRSTELTELDLVRSRPVPFPPEPFAWAVIQATRWSLAWADAHTGRRNAWLRLLDRVGLGYDS